MAVIKAHLLHHQKLRRLSLALKTLYPELAYIDRDSLAIALLVRLWLHAETSKVWRFKNMNPESLAAVCQWEREAAWLWQTLQDCGWIELKGTTLIVHDWQVHNASLVASWNRGKYGNLGGRPKGSSPETSKVPRENPSRVEKSRVSRTANAVRTPPDSPKGESDSPRPPDGQFRLDASLEIKGPRGLPPSVEEMIEDAKTRYEPDDVEKALCCYQDWRRTPKGRGKRLTAMRWALFLRDCRPKKEEGAHQENGIEPEVPGWKELMLEANPELNNLPTLWGELSPQGRAWARELAREKEKTTP